MGGSDYTILNLTQLYQEVYYTGCLSPKDKATYDLICRYESKVSARLLTIKKQLFVKGREAYKVQFQDILKKYDAVWSSMFKANGIPDSYMPVPIKYGKD